MDQNHPVWFLRANFPVGTISRAVRALGRSQRTVQRWLSGEMDVPPEDDDKLRDSWEALESVSFDENLHALIQKALDQGAMPEAVGSHLARAHERLLSKEID